MLKARPTVFGAPGFFAFYGVCLWFRQVNVRRFRPPCRGERLANVKAHRLNRTTRPLLQYLPKPRDAGEIHYFYPSHSQYFAEAAV